MKKYKMKIKEDNAEYDWYNFDGYKTKFTKENIEEKCPFYANGTCMIKVEDVE